MASDNQPLLRDQRRRGGSGSGSAGPGRPQRGSGAGQSGGGKPAAASSGGGAGRAIRVVIYSVALITVASLQQVFFKRLGYSLGRTPRFFIFIMVCPLLCRLRARIYSPAHPRSSTLRTSLPVLDLGNDFLFFCAPVFCHRMPACPVCLVSLWKGARSIGGGDLCARRNRRRLFSCSLCHALQLGVIYCLSGGFEKEITTVRFKVHFLVIGFFNALNGVFVIFANPHTPGSLQAVLAQVCCRRRCVSGDVVICWCCVRR